MRSIASRFEYFGLAERYQRVLSGRVVISRRCESGLLGNLIPVLLKHEFANVFIQKKLINNNYVNINLNSISKLRFESQKIKMVIEKVNFK